MASEKLRVLVELRKRRAQTTWRATGMRRKVRVTDGRLDDELPPAQLRLPPAHATYVNPMELFQHTLQVAGVVRKDGRAHKFFMFFCASCGAYYCKEPKRYWHPAGQEELSR